MRVHPLRLSEAIPYLRYTYSSYEQWLKQKKEESDLPVILIGATASDHQPVGLVLAQRHRNEPVASLYSVAVKRAYQQQGIGTRMIKALEEEAKKQRVERLKVRYYSVRHVKGFESLLDKAGWTGPQLYSRYYHIDLERLRTSPFWMKRSVPIPSSYKIFSWNEVTDEELEAVGELDETAFRPYYRPMNEPEAIVPECSFVIKRNDDIVGWSIIEQTLGRILKYRVLYIRESHRHTGIGIRLAMETVRHIPYVHNDRGVIEVTDHNELMSNVVKKIQSTLQPAVYACYTSEKRLHI